MNRKVRIAAAIKVCGMYISIPSFLQVIVYPLLFIIKDTTFQTSILMFTGYPLLSIVALIFGLVLWTIRNKTIKDNEMKSMMNNIVGLLLITRVIFAYCGIISRLQLYINHSNPKIFHYYESGLIEIMLHTIILVIAVVLIRDLFSKRRSESQPSTGEIK